jgi:hypothetical protein
MSTTKRPVLSFTHTVFRGLQEDIRTSIRELPLATPSALRNGLIEAHTKLSDYYYKSDESPYYTWAARTCHFNISILCLSTYSNLVLDPRISYEGLKADFEHDEELLDGLEAAKSKLETHFRLHYADKVAPSAQPSVRQPAQSTSRIQASPEKDFTKRYRVARRAAFDELRDYYSLSCEDFNTCDPVQWWFARKAQFPNLFCLARDILTIPGTDCRSAFTLVFNLNVRLCCRC